MPTVSDNDEDGKWRTVKSGAYDEVIEEYTDEQRVNIVSIMQTVPFGGDLFSTVWPDWLCGRDYIEVITAL